jgi:hypothetical protein
MDEADKNDNLSFYSAQSQFLDFTLYGFRSKNKPLTKLRGSSKLFPFTTELHIENLTLNDDVAMEGNHSEGRRIFMAIEEFSNTYKKFKDKRMSSLMHCLSEIISLNPNYSSEK